METVYEERMYKANERCPKCGHNKLQDKFCKGGEVRMLNRICVFGHEHIHRLCLRCGYDWRVRPLDSEE